MQVGRPLRGGQRPDVRPRGDRHTSGHHQHRDQHREESTHLRHVNDVLFVPVAHQQPELTMERSSLDRAFHRMPHRRRGPHSGADTETHPGVEPGANGVAGRPTTVVTWARCGVTDRTRTGFDQSHGLVPRLLRLRSQSSWRESNLAASRMSRGRSASELQDVECACQDSNLGSSRCGRDALAAEPHARGRRGCRTLPDDRARIVCAPARPPFPCTAVGRRGLEPRTCRLRGGRSDQLS